MTASIPLHSGRSASGMVSYAVKTVKGRTQRSRHCGMQPTQVSWCASHPRVMHCPCLDPASRQSLCGHELRKHPSVLLKKHADLSAAWENFIVKGGIFSAGAEAQGDVHKRHRIEPAQGPWRNDVGVFEGILPDIHPPFACAGVVHIHQHIVTFDENAFDPGQLVGIKAEASR